MRDSHQAPLESTTPKQSNSDSRLRLREDSQEHEGQPLKTFKSSEEQDATAQRTNDSKDTNMAEDSKQLAVKGKPKPPPGWFRYTPIEDGFRNWKARFKQSKKHELIPPVTPGDHEATTTTGTIVMAQFKGFQNPLAPNTQECLQDPQQWAHLFATTSRSSNQQPQGSRRRQGKSDGSERAIG